MSTPLQAPSPALTAAGFTSSLPVTRRRLIVATSGAEGSGKSHLALSAPSPIAYFNLDKGTEGVADKPIFRNKQIWPIDFSVPPLTVLTEQQEDERWDKFKRGYDAALRDSQVRTVAVDKMTTAWAMARLARFHKLEQVPEFKYIALNREFAALIEAAYNFDKNLILIHNLKKRYIKPAGSTKGEWDGQYETDGFNRTPDAVQVNLLQYWDAARGGPVIRILKCRPDSALIGTELDTPTAAAMGGVVDFTMLAQTVYMGTTAEEWR